MLAPDRLIPAWSTAQRSAVDTSTVTFPHGLEAAGAFGDAALAALIDGHPRHMIDVCTMRRDPPPDEPWIAGSPGDLSGAELLEAVRRGALWISLRQAVNNADKPLMSAITAALEACTGRSIVSATASILISSPHMGVFYHVDTVETVLLHMRGRKTMWVYPAREPYVTEAALQAILHKENLSDCPWRPEMEREAQPVALAPGQGLHIPLNAPHRVVNGGDLNVSVSVGYSTRRSRTVNGVLWFNGFLKRRLGVSISSRRLPAALHPTWWLAGRAAQRLLPARRNVESAHERRFVVDLAAPECVRWLTPEPRPLERQAA